MYQERFLRFSLLYSFLLLSNKPNRTLCSLASRVKRCVRLFTLPDRPQHGSTFSFPPNDVFADLFMIFINGSSSRIWMLLEFLWFLFLPFTSENHKKRNLSLTQSVVDVFSLYFFFRAHKQTKPFSIWFTVPHAQQEILETMESKTRFYRESIYDTKVLIYSSLNEIFLCSATVNWRLSGPGRWKFPSFIIIRGEGETNVGTLKVDLTYDSDCMLWHMP